jgi:hypothetical protein
VILMEPGVGISQAGGALGHRAGESLMENR